MSTSTTNHQTPVWCPDGLKTVTMSKATYLALPVAHRRTWKDGTRLVLLHRTGASPEWRKVEWNS